MGGGKVAAGDDSKEKVSYGDVWDEAEEELNRKETNQRTSNIFRLCAGLQNGICPKGSN